MKRLAVLPARGGSKRIPGKNIKDFHGNPLISYALNAAKNSGVFDKIHVSTDDEKIFETVSGLGFEPDFKRPSELADDFTPMFDVMKHVVRTYQAQGEDFDTVFIIFPTAPLIDSLDIQKAAIQFEKTDGSRAMLTMTEFPTPIEWAFRMDKSSGVLEPVTRGGFLKRSQDLQPAYYEAAMFAVFSRSFVLNNTIDNIDQKSIGYNVPASRVVDIDTPEHWKFAEKLYAAHQK